jgi:hypothetical protein
MEEACRRAACHYVILYANRTLFVLVVAHAATSLLHFVHNAAFLEDYPNMPAWISPVGIYAVWLAEAAIGALGVLLLLRGRSVGLALIAVYAVLGLGGLDHYTLAPVSAHTLAMNATIWLETATAIALLVFAAGMFRARLRRAL